MKFTQDWFTPNIVNFERIRDLIGRPERILELGCFEGRATVWMLQNMLDPKGHICCVDTFKGGEEHAGLDLSELRLRFNHNINSTDQAHQVTVMESTTFNALLGMNAWSNRLYDFIYIDASHEARHVLEDSVLAWRILKEGGVMLWDDYGGGATVGVAVDAFCLCHKDEFDVVLTNYQVGIRKRLSAS